jgi:hypothetical protein
MIDPNKIKKSLAQFSGSEELHTHSIGPLSMDITDGCQYLAEACECFWLFDKILSIQKNPKLKNEGFQVWKLSRLQANGFSLKCTEGNKHVIYTEKIENSDFPLNDIIIWKSGSTCMLPGEY